MRSLLGTALTSTVTRLLGLGSLGFAAWGLLRPDTLAQRMGIGPSAARWIGVRDAVIGTLLLVRPGSTSLGARALADVSDTVQTWEHDRRSGLVALTSAAVATTLAVGARQRGRPPA